MIEYFDNKVIIVSEFTNNHCGNVKTALKMMDISKAIGADYVKLQKRDVENFYPLYVLNSPYKSPFGRTFRDYRGGVEFTYDEFQTINKYSKKIKMPWFCSVLDVKSAEMMAEFDVDMVKIPSTVSHKSDLFDYVAKTRKFKRVVFSTGGCAIKEIKEKLDILRQKKQIYLLQCISAYPPPIDELNLNVIHLYRDMFCSKFKNVLIGYSSHELEPEISCLAVACGAKMIEKHFTIERSPWIHFSHVAYLPDEMKMLIEQIRRTETVLGNYEKKVGKSETHKYIYSKN